MKPSNAKSLLAAMSGTMIEWFDYGLFGFLAPVLAELFFPPHANSWVSLLQAFMVFAMGFLLRPLGGLFFGSLADRFGRVVVLRTTILLVSLPSVFIACLPTYAAIGSFSTVLLIILRMLQGLSVGGEFAGSMVYITEISPPRYKTLFSGLVNNASNIGILLGVGLCGFITSIFTHEAFMQYGWRIPFFLGGLSGIAAYSLRKYFLESEIFICYQQDNKLHEKPIRELFKNNKIRLVMGMAFSCMGACGIYTMTVYLSTYLEIVKHYSLSSALSLESALLIVTLFLVPVSSLLANRVGRIRILKTAVLGNVVYSILAFHLLPENNLLLAGVILLPIIIFISIEQGNMPATLTEYFPVAILYSGVSIAYNMSYAYVGGMAPMYMTWLIGQTHSPLIPGICITFASAITGIALLRLSTSTTNNELLNSQHEPLLPYKLDLYCY